MGSARRAWYVAVFALGLIPVGCSTGGPASRGQAASAFWFASVPEIVATSDVVVLGTVTDVRDGTTEGPPGEEIQHLDAEIRVEEVLYGWVGPPSVLTIQTLRFVAPPREWRTEGATVLAFLKRSADAPSGGRYYPMNDQSVYLVESGDIQSAVEADPLSERIASMSLDEIRAAIAAAVPAIEAGSVTPQPPVGG